MSNIFLVNGYDKRKNPEKHEYRFLSVEEIKRIPQNSHHWFVANDGTAREAKITLIKTWKTRPTEVEIHLKYGLYEYASFNTMQSVHRLIVKVED